MSLHARRSRSPLALLLLVMLSAAGLPAPVPAQAGRAYTLDPGRSQIRFRATSRFVDADGRFRRFRGELRLDPDHPESAAGRVTVNVASIDTGIADRDDHLRSPDFFDVERHPVAEFVLATVRREEGRLWAQGTLAMRGISHPLALPVDLTSVAPGVRLSARFTVSRRAFGIVYESFLNPIGDEVEVWVDLVATPR